MTDLKSGSKLTGFKQGHSSNDDNFI